MGGCVYLFIVPSQLEEAVGIQGLWESFSEQVTGCFPPKGPYKFSVYHR